MIKKINEFIVKYYDDIIAYFLLIMYTTTVHPEKASMLTKLVWLFIKGLSRVQP